MTASLSPPCRLIVSSRSLQYQCQFWVTILWRAHKETWRCMKVLEQSSFLSNRFSQNRMMKPLTGNHKIAIMFLSSFDIFSAFSFFFWVCFYAMKRKNQHFHVSMHVWLISFFLFRAAGRRLSLTFINFVCLWTMDNYKSWGKYAHWK